jgi:hypothetical protein
MSFDNLYDMSAAAKQMDAAEGSYAKSIQDWVGKIRDRQITLRPVNAAAYATPAKPPRIIRSFWDVQNTSLYSEGRTEYFLNGREFKGLVIEVNGCESLYVPAGAARILMGACANDMRLRLIAVVYAKCN